MPRDEPASPLPCRNRRTGALSESKSGSTTKDTSRLTRFVVTGMLIVLTRIKLTQNPERQTRNAHLHKERPHLQPCALLAHTLIVRSRSEPVRRVEYLGQETDISDGGQEDPGPCQYPV